MSRESFWAEYYENVARKGEPWLDYSNERVQAQTFGLVLEALGPLAGRNCLDVGCGFGQMSRTFVAMGAERVLGLDLSQELISKLQGRFPEIDFRRGSLGDPALRASLGSFDRICLIEVLQYLPIFETLEQAWSLLEPDGRLVVVVPNRACPIVERAVERFVGNYLPPTATELGDALSKFSDAWEWQLQGLWFAIDQTLYPYVRGDGSSSAVAPRGAAGEGTLLPPNRLLLTVHKRPPV
jgi:2-polyprenyl-3-methyl-5-hydroxy-6-metoxy-1,4-benzoquinol methylase